VFPRIASGVTGLPESIASQALRFLCVCNLLFGGEDRRFLLARPSVGAIGEVVGGPTTREEASRRGGRWRGASVFVRVGIVAAGGGVVYGTTRAEETSSPPPRGRRGWERLWLATGLVVPGVAEERHGELGYCKRECVVDLVDSPPSVAQYFIAKITRERQWNQVDPRQASLWRMWVFAPVPNTGQS
jgi:hypothetical protein